MSRATAGLFVSGLDSSTSLLPMAIKDGADIVGRTSMAYSQTDEKTRNHEARERFIEEVGTSVLWLGAIPLLRKIFDKTLFEIMHLDPNLSLKKVLDKKSPQYIKILNKSLTKAENEALRSKYKYANIAKTLVSTLIPFYLLAVTLPHFNQSLTKKMLKKSEGEHNSPNDVSVPQNNINKNTFQGLNHKKDEIKFKGWLNNFNPISLAQNAQIDPAGSTLILDYGTSGSRVVMGRKGNEKLGISQERWEIACKEAGIIFFFYKGAGLIKKALEAGCDKLGKSIKLDYVVLKSDNFKDYVKGALADQSNKSKFSQIISSKSQKDLLKDDELAHYINEKIRKPNKLNSKVLKIVQNVLNGTEEENLLEKIRKNPAKSIQNAKNFKEIASLVREHKILKYIDKAIKEDYDFKQDKFRTNATLQHAKDLGLLGEKEGFFLGSKDSKKFTDLLKDIQAGKKSIRNSDKYIETDKLIELSNEMKKYFKYVAESVKDSANKEKMAEKVIESCKNYKKAMIFLNLAICNVALGYGMPKLQYFIREKVWGSKEFPGTKKQQ